MPLLIDKHIRLTPEPSDGTRLCVMRYWPANLARHTVDDWLPDLAPSPALFKWAKSQPEPLPLFADPNDAVLTTQRWQTYSERYIAEMQQAAPQRLIAAIRRRLARGDTISLLCACHDVHHCHRSLLAEII